MAYSPQSSVRAELARAKVNLALHITGQRSDGFHLLDSLAVFPQIGDRIAIEPADTLELIVDGPFARDLEGGTENNLVLKSLNGFAESAGIVVPKVKITLTKRLPVASGIGGGSSDAATTLRLLEDITGHYLAEDELHKLATSLGADVPVCLEPEPQFMRGIGEDLSPGPSLPACGIVLVNPKVGVETPAVFKALEHRKNPPLPKAPAEFDDLAALTHYLESSRNDLQVPALSVCPEIADVLTALDADSRVVFTRMSGSGATCFGLCENTDTRSIEMDLRSAHPNWWVASGPLR
ncbi:4-(cytidine 5'-diphospho)-2-C-methyl-D-erythritol kinase [Labrenzia sp. PHM005]|uniref:4-(cytidine 5'-diphospho)-2-C-methyl-D-erythritol kinase n=1 Tax=Labrenzia sp. PHM005 TaxID=2590016 RepID=UPI00114006BD|nr:4-(cytidine 5'-diphospho)-2-C-methyl-D-erythritol kinase [Labrenzia sp. PHM005]QDG77011.1 4-(cytidine 5'-diphospho)-2-C-methyl-D-erythritol kinase [Labrenzia sp. PHM005]